MKRFIGLALLILLATETVQAQAIRNAKEANDNREAIAIGKAQFEKDQQQLVDFKIKVNAFESAFRNKNVERMKILKADILSDMRREIEQSERKIAQDKKEVLESKSEANSSRREKRRARHDVNDGDTDAKEVRRLRDDRRDQRDDRRDLKDDQNDLEKQIARTARQKEIFNTLKAFTFTANSSKQEKAVANKRLMNEFITTMERDLAATKLEIAEDKQEAGEDRRERREDRRTRRDY